MDNVKFDGPVDILVTLGLTLPNISDAELEEIGAAAPAGSTVRVAPTMKEAIATAGDAEVILGFIPKPLFSAAPKLRWVHCIASGMDMFLYPDMLASEVVLTGEKGLVGGHLADAGFGGTGRAMARRAVAFGMDVLACDVVAVAPSDGVAEVWTMDRLDDLLG